MKTHPIIAVAVLAASILHAAGPEHTLPAPLPEFKPPEQLAVWRKEMADKAKAGDAAVAKQDRPATSTSTFYTGKPFLSETGSYAFKFRQYDPELSRWITADPSGFPDGANSHVYGNSPVSGLDPNGLSWSTSDFLWHFYFGGGEGVSLSSIGYLDGVKNVANTSGTGGVYRFDAHVTQVANGMSKPYDGTFTDDFNRSYDFSSVKYELGSGVLSGEYSGSMTCTPFTSMAGGTYTYTGPATITYSDTFTDPLGIINYFYGSSTSSTAPSWLAAAADFGGTAFPISDSWVQTLSGSGVYE